MTEAQAEPDLDMPSEIDFSQGTRGRFFRRATRLELPVYLDDEVQVWLAARAAARGVEIGQIVNGLIRQHIETAG